MKLNIFNNFRAVYYNTLVNFYIYFNTIVPYYDDVILSLSITSFKNILNNNNLSLKTIKQNRMIQLLYSLNGKDDIIPLGPDDVLEERELFWLYFPNLRDYLVNYYIYNNKSDVSTLSFDDLFWKRQFNSQIYKTTNKFDDEVEEYKYGVDALYEAERIKNEIRNWEMDLWEY